MSFCRLFTIITSAYDAVAIGNLASKPTCAGPQTSGEAVSADVAHLAEVAALLARVLHPRLTAQPFLIRPLQGAGPQAISNGQRDQG